MSRTGGRRRIFDGLPIPADKSYLKEGLSRIDEGWAAARFDSLPHVVHILTSKDREGEIQFLKEQSDLIEDVVDEVVHAYHHGFNKAIQNYSQILRLFSESAESITGLKGEMAEAKKLLGRKNKHLGQLWYRSLTLRHVLSLLDQVEDVAKVPARIENLMAEKQLYAAVQLHVQSMLMLEREGLQAVGALQDVRSDLAKLRGVLFYKILEELHSHLYNNGEYSSVTLSMVDNEELPTSTATGRLVNSMQPLSRRTRSIKGDNHFGASADGIPKTSSVGGSSFDGPDDDSSIDMHESDGGRSRRDSKSISREVPIFLSCATPDEFLESVTKADASLSVKYLRTLVQCLSMLGKVAAAGAVICQRVRPTIHDVITSKIRAYSEETSKSNVNKAANENSDVSHSNGRAARYQLLKQKTKNGASLMASQLVVSPISPAMAPTGDAQCAASQLLSAIFECLVDILENHITVGELLEQKSSTEVDNANTPHMANGDASWNPDSESSQATGGFTVAFSLSVVQSECQQLLCEILRATPEAATADAAVQTARLANKDPVKEKRDGSEGLSFAFRITDAAITAPNEVAGQGWRRNSTVPQEGYGTASVIPDQGIFLAASVYRPVFEFMNKIGLMLPQKYWQLGNDGLLAFVNNFLKEHFLPAIFVDYRKCVQQAISSPAAFRPRVHATSVYSPLVENGRPVLQGLLAVDIIAKEVLGWVQLMPNYATELVEYVRTFLERTHERCRASYMEAVLEKQSYILLSRNDVESLMRLDPANLSLQNSFGQLDHSIPDAEAVEVEIELSDLLLDMCPIKQENLIHDDQKLILLASLSDSLEYLADSVERLGESFINSSTMLENKNHIHQGRHTRSTSAIPKSLASLANEYRRLAIDCVRVLRLEMQLETIYHMQEMTKREYVEDQDAEDPDDFIISLTTQIARRDEEMAPYIAESKRNYVFGGISSVAANASIKALAQMKSINLLGVQQICRNSIALEQALAAIPSIDSEAVQQRIDRVRTFYELLNLPFESLLGFIAEHEYLFSAKEYLSVLKVNVPGREMPMDAERRISQILGH
ncbi:exocyst complex component SEC8 isoform X1 [Oryza sativa Japonica Group]|uniref:exocyst complex component SEC8 isoform X1 n=1 Tax=Oryza sativa subsp. japonica TaxID=39947 RepID=UPI0007753D43|nr:exocyst complex component SEC8 isoform X1 [Oryza sativa Japonica Group]